MPRWLVSYRRHSVLFNAERNELLHTPSTDHIEVWDEHPAKMAADFANMLIEHMKPDGDDFYRHSQYFLDCIYSAIEIPDGIHSELEMLNLRFLASLSREKRKDGDIEISQVKIRDGKPEG
jgi:hypothetical protein